MAQGTGAQNHGPRVGYSGNRGNGRASSTGTVCQDRKAALHHMRSIVSIECTPGIAGRHFSWLGTLLDIPFPFGQSILIDKSFIPEETKKKEEILYILKRKKTDDCGWSKGAPDQMGSGVSIRNENREPKWTKKWNIEGAERPFMEHREVVNAE